MRTISLLLLGSILTLTITSCGTKEAEKPEKERINSADLYEAEKPTYDAAAINPDAAVVPITIIADGNTMAEMKYDQKEIKVKAGTTVQLTLKNNSTDASMPHNWVLVHEGTAERVATAGIEAGKAKNYVPDSKDVLIATTMTGPGETAVITFPAPPAGKYQFVCTYPGHWSIMNGEFIVE